MKNNIFWPLIISPPRVWLIHPLVADQGILVDGGLDGGEGELLVLQAAGEPGHQAQTRGGDLR